MADFHRRSQFMKQYLEYMQANWLQIERLTQREMKKIQLIEDYDLANDEEKKVVGPANPGQDDKLLLFSNDLFKLKHASYLAEDLNIENLPLCQLFIFREEIAKQQYIRGQIQHQDESYLLESAIASGTNDEQLPTSQKDSTSSKPLDSASSPGRPQR